MGGFVKTLIDSLVEGLGREEALRRAFEGVDWRELERDFRDYVFELD